MSFICRVVIGHFDADDACSRRSITVTRPVSEEEVACLEATCEEVFGIKPGLSNHLTREGVLCLEDIVVRKDTYKAAAVAHGLLGMSAVDHAHRCVIFPAEDKPLPEREQLLEWYQSLHRATDEQQLQQQAEDDLRRMREDRQFERGIREQVRSLTAGWQGRPGQSWLTPDIVRLARAAYEERRGDVLPILADALEEAGCTDQSILDHLRGRRPHVRGCWALALVLAKG